MCGKVKYMHRNNKYGIHGGCYFVRGTRLIDSLTLIFITICKVLFHQSVGVTRYFMCLEYI
jgi:hypothetical protein